MARPTVLAAGALALALLGAAPAGAVTPPPPPGPTTVTCGAYGLQSGLMTRLCAEVTGSGVQFVGQISLAGPPSPGGPGGLGGPGGAGGPGGPGGSIEPPAPTPLITTLTGDVVGGVSIGMAQQELYFMNQTLQVRGVGGTVSCGSVVHGTFAVASYPWSPVPVTVEVPVTC